MSSWSAASTSVSAQSWCTQVSLIIMEPDRCASLYLRGVLHRVFWEESWDFVLSRARGEGIFENPAFGPICVTTVHNVMKHRLHKGRGKYLGRINIQTGFRNIFGTTSKKSTFTFRRRWTHANLYHGKGSHRDRWGKHQSKRENQFLNIHQWLWKTAFCFLLSSLANITTPIHILQLHHQHQGLSLDLVGCGVQASSKKGEEEEGRKQREETG